MSNKGFTLIELITTFALAAIIAILLINVLVSIRNLYSNTSVRKELYINQSNLSNALNSKIQNGKITRHTSCETEVTDALLCYDFELETGEERLIVRENQILFGKYTYNLDEKTKVENADFINERVFYHLIISIRNEFYPDTDFGINLVYLR